VDPLNQTYEILFETDAPTDFYALFSVRVKISTQGNDAKFTKVRLCISAKLPDIRFVVSLSDSRPV